MHPGVRLGYLGVERVAEAHETGLPLPVLIEADGGLVEVHRHGEADGGLEARARGHSTRRWQPCGRRAHVDRSDAVRDPEELRLVDHDPRDFVDVAPVGARYVLPDVDLNKKAWFTALKASVVAHLLAGQTTEVLRNAGLKLASRPGETAEAFAARCQAAADAGADAEAAKIRDALTKKMDRLRVSIATAEDRVETARTSASSAKTNEFVGAAGSVLSNLLGGRRSVRGIAGDVRGASSRRGRTETANRRIEEAENRLGEKTDDLAALEQDLQETLVEIDDKWAEIAAGVDTVQVGLEKTDIRVDDLFVIWFPVA